MNGAGSIWYQLGIDNTRLQRDADKSSKIFRGIGDTVESEGARIDNIVKRLTSGIAAMGVSLGAGALVKQIVSVRGEFQQLGIAFETMLGSKERADSLMSQLVTTAAKTPFDLTGVATGAKQLLAYGTAAEEVNDTLIRLGNIASGLSIPLNDLVYLYGTTQVQGRLFTQDVRQFMGRGIPLVQQLALELGKTEGEINDMVTAGKIGFPEVQRVINNLTNEGGMFFNLMEKQSASLTGQISNLQDAWDMMLNDIGSKSEGVFSGAIGVATSLVENYEKVGKVLLGIVATYGAYKTALIIASQAQSGWNTVQLLHYNRLLLVERAQKLLNLTMLANPYVLVSVAAVGLIATMWALHDSTTAQEKAQQRLNNITEETAKKKETLENKTSSLISVINSETKTILDQIVAYKELQSLYPKWLKDMDIATFKAKSLQDQQLLLNEAVNEMQINDKSLEVEASQNKIASLKEQLNSINSISVSYKGIRDQLKELIKEESIVLENLQQQKNEMQKLQQEAEFRSKPEAEQLKILNEQLSNLEDQKRKIEEITDKASGLGSPFEKLTQSARNAFFELTGISSEITRIQRLISALTGNTQSQDKNKSFYQKQKQDAQEVIDLMDKSKKGSKEWNEQLKLIDDANKNLKVWDFSKNSRSGGGKTSSKSSVENVAKRIIESEEWLQKKQKEIGFEQIKSALDLEQKLLDIDNDSFEKQQKQNELNHRKELLAIKEFESNRVREQQEVARQMYIREKGSDKGFDFAKFDTSTLPEGLRTEDIQAQVNALTSAVQSAWEKADEVAYKAEIERINELLAKHQDYNAKRLAIEKQYQKDLQELNKLPDSEQKNAAIAQLEKDRKASIKAVNDEEAAELVKTTDLFIRLFTDASQQSVRQIRKVIDETQALYDYLSNTKDEDITANFGFTAEQLKTFKGDAEQLKAILDGLIAKKRELAGKSEFQAFSQSIGDAIKKIEKGGAENIGGGISDIGSAINQITPQIKQFGNDLGTIFGDEKLAEDIGLATDALGGLATTGAGVGQIMSGDIVGGIQNVVSGVASLVGVFGKLKDRKREKEIQKLQKQVELLEKAYQSLGRAIDKAYSKDASELIGQQNEALEKQKVLIQQQIKAEKDKKKTDNGRIKEWEKQIEEIDLLIEENKEKAIDAIFGQDIKSAIEDFADAYVEAWSAGEDRAKASKDFVKKMIKQMVVEAMKADISEPMKKIREKLEQFWQDGFISANEEDIINHMVEQLDKELGDKYAWADKYLDNSKSSSQSSSSKGFETITQDQAGEFNGRFTALQMSGVNIEKYTQLISSDIRGLYDIQIDSNRIIKTLPISLVEFREICLQSMYHLEDINKNTKQLFSIREKLEAIDKNTKDL